MRSKQGASENPQGSTTQPIELSSPISEQYLQLELEGQDNPESEPEEGIGHFKYEQRNELGHPPTLNMSTQDDLLHDFELAQVVANMNVYMQHEGLLNLNSEETQSPKNSSDTRILSPSKDASHEAEIDVEAI